MNNIEKTEDLFANIPESVIEVPSRDLFEGMHNDDDLFSPMDREKNEHTISVDIEVVKGDITTREVDVIVNAAHEGLTGGGGVDGAIHMAAGQKLLGECLGLYGCPTGEARITNGYDLPAKYIIHTVGPVWTPDQSTRQKAIVQLSRCYKNSLTLAEMQGLKSIAFPCISTGAYCFPKEIAATIAVHSVYSWFNAFMSHLENDSGSYLDLVEFVCFTDEDVEFYRKAIADEEMNMESYNESNTDCRINILDLDNEL